MRLLIWLLRIVVFLLLLAFLSRNSGPVEVRLFLDSSWQLPLAMLMLLFFAVGVLLGASATMATGLRQRREVVKLKARLRQIEDDGASFRETSRSG
ncbi:MAG TPA: LapA family protein [Rhodocyclaceae bacterium]|nr:LapA family protein [Rhodocyclaceae bacterium]HMV53120.1 LapA family protein [Rhodocyclaceae bacterium]HNA03846.1 LapA family protein [Rhodocyclaceae bacterium]HNB79393.1 LapA family protein [Rhodocyclaceae bacterium]HNC61349.1 LapA family protein [Rhodocyclaceae bacterium]